MEDDNGKTGRRLGQNQTSANRGPSTGKSNSDQKTPAEAGRQLIRTGLKAALASLDARSGHPSASLITLATMADNRPIFLISALAVHTRNLKADPRASILLDGTGGLGDPLAGGRLTLIGTVEQIEDPAARSRFLARHPSAELYADFGDFAFYVLEIERAHYVGGFGQIADIEPARLLTATTEAQALLAGEQDILAHMNADHGEAIMLYASRLCAGPAGPWRMSGIDPDGMDLVLHSSALRLDFPFQVKTPEQAREILVKLAKDARAA